MAIRNPDNVVSISTNRKDFFKVWLTFLSPFHNMTGRQIDVASMFLYFWYQMTNGEVDSKIDSRVLNECIRKKVREECDITPSHFLVTISALKKKGFLKDGGINPRYIPSLKMEADKKEGNYFLMLYFQITNEEC